MKSFLFLPLSPSLFLCVLNICNKYALWIANYYMVFRLKYILKPSM